MTIATWNVERPTRTSKRNSVIIDCIKKINPDILILTETNEFIDFGDKYNSFHTTILSDSVYKDGERRTSIYSKYKSVGQFETFRDDTSICIDFLTPFGNLAVYGTVIGVYGNRRKSFMEDLDMQILDFDRIGRNRNFCISGDLNMSFEDKYYFTKQGRTKLNASFDYLSLKNLTGNIAENIDHIILTKSFIGDRIPEQTTWNSEPKDLKLSDHIGVSITLI